jgi:hypothetical protein
MASKTYGDLTDYQTGAHLRHASKREWEASVQAAQFDGGAGVITVGGRRVFVQGGPAERKKRNPLLANSAGVPKRRNHWLLPLAVGVPAGMILEATTGVVRKALPPDPYAAEWVAKRTRNPTYRAVLDSDASPRSVKKMLAAAGFAGVRVRTVKGTGKKKAPGAYAQFVKKHMADFKGRMSAPEAMKAIGKLWRERGAAKSNPLLANPQGGKASPVARMTQRLDQIRKGIHAYRHHPSREERSELWMALKELGRAIPIVRADGANTDVVAAAQRELVRDMTRVDRDLEKQRKDEERAWERLYQAADRRAKRTR